MTAVLDFLAFIWASLISPHGMCVSVLFAGAVWLQVGVQKLRDRAAERAHLAELNAVLATIPDRPEKTLMTRQEAHRAA